MAIAWGFHQPPCDAGADGEGGGEDESDDGAQSVDQWPPHLVMIPLSPLGGEVRASAERGRRGPGRDGEGELTKWLRECELRDGAFRRAPTPDGLSQLVGLNGTSIAASGTVTTNTAGRMGVMIAELQIRERRAETSSPTISRRAQSIQRAARNGFTFTAWTVPDAKVVR